MMTYGLQNALRKNVNVVLRIFRVMKGKFVSLLYIKVISKDHVSMKVLFQKRH